MNKATKLFNKRKARVHNAIRTNNKTGKLRLSVFRSNKHIYAQLIDDSKGITLVAASTKSAELKDLTQTSNIEAAARVGKSIALKAKEKNLNVVVFDKGAYQYHGRVKALAEAAREHGLEF